MPFYSSLAKRAFSVLCLAIWFFAQGFCFASNDPAGYRVGFDGQIKLGCWSPVFFELTDETKPTRFEITAPDGNGIPVKFSGDLAAEENIYQAWFKTGRSTGQVRIDLKGPNDQTVESFEFQLGDKTICRVIDATVPFCLTIEPAKTIAEDIKAIQTQLFKRGCEVVAIGDASKLPLTANAYAAIRIIYLTTSDVELINSISQQQWNALDRWVANGGKLILSVGKNCETVLKQKNDLARFLPGEFDGPLLIEKSSQFENYTQSRRGQLLKRNDDPLRCTKLSNVDGITELSISRNPIVVRRPYQFGQVVFSAADFDIDPFASWIGQKNFLLRLTFGQLNLNRTLSTESNNRSVVRYGANDILGQLIFPLEKFSKVGFINFTVVAILIAIFILCIGPGDYFLLKKLIGKMEWTWLTFTFFAVGFCSLAIFLSAATKPKQIQVNQLEIIDFDTTANSVRGSIWTNIFSPTNIKCNLVAESENLIEIDTSNTVSSWMGLPGDGLGGMRSMSSPGLVVQQYDCEFMDAARRSQIDKLPIKVSSTKPIHSEYFSQKDIGVRSRLLLNRNTNQLQGTITNPFDFELRDCRVVFENWTYVLRRPLAPGESIDVFDMNEQTTSSYFSRRQEMEDSKGGDVPWNPEEDDIDRIAEVVMFYDAAGGERYTRLSHGYQSNLDMTEQLYLERAVLFGKAPDVCTKLLFEDGVGDIEYDQCRTFVRVLLPVSYKKR